MIKHFHADHSRRSIQILKKFNSKRDGNQRMRSEIAHTSISYRQSVLNSTDFSNLRSNSNRIENGYHESN